MKKMFIPFLAALCILCVFTGCKQTGNLLFSSYPDEGIVGDALSAVSVTIQTGARSFANNNRNAVPITCRLLDPNNNGGILSGTMTQTTSNGRATFNDLSINQPGTGYQMVFSARGCNDLISPKFTITPQGGIDLEFSAEPADTKSHAPFSMPVRVRILDGQGRQLNGGNHKITLGLAENPGELILHAAGTPGSTPGDRFLEIIEPRFSDNATGSTLPRIYHWLKYPPMDTPIAAMAYDHVTRGVYAATAGDNGDVLWIYPPTGRQVLIGYQSLDNVNGLAFDTKNKSNFDNAAKCLDNETMAADNCSKELRLRLVAVLNSSASLPADHLYEIDQDYGAYKDLGPVTMSDNASPDDNTTQGTQTINGFFGLAADPQTGMLYAAVDTGNAAGYDIATIDTTTMQLQIKGNTGLELASIAIGKDGTLYGLTGRGATPPATLYKISKETGTVDNNTQLALDNEATGGGAIGTAVSAEAITIMPAYLTGNKADAVDGEAVFPKLVVHAIGSGYKLIAENGNLNCAFSNAFNVTAPVIGGATVEFAATTFEVVEGAGENSTVMLMISEPQDHNVIVTMAASQGTATDASQAADADISLFYFEGPAGIGQNQVRNYIAEPYYQVEIPAGKTGAPFKFEAYADNQTEDAEDFSMIILDASLAGSIGDNATATITINDSAQTQQ